MTDLEKVELAARNNADAINKSVWLDQGQRQLLSNCFLAFADEIRAMRKPSWEPEDRERSKLVCG